jgi:hypothetical protein
MKNNTSPFYGGHSGKWMEKLMDKKWGLLMMIFFISRLKIYVHFIPLSCTSATVKNASNMRLEKEGKKIQ